MSAETLSATTGPTKPGVRPYRSPQRNGEGEIVCIHEECKDSRPTFKRLCEFNKHMDKHERPYKCNNAACKKNPGFTYAGGLLRHQREVHSMHRTKDPFFCPHSSCNRSTGSGFSRRENLEEHLRRRHSGISINVDDSATESTTSPRSAIVQVHTDARTSVQLETLPASRKRRAATEAETGDRADRDQDGSDELRELRRRIVILSQDNERIRSELFRRDQLLTEMSQENNRLRGMLSSTLPPLSVPHVQTQTTQAVYHQQNPPIG